MKHRVWMMTLFLLGMMLLAACGGEEASSPAPPTPVVDTAVATVPPTVTPADSGPPPTQPPPPTIAAVPTSTPEGGVVEEAPQVEGVLTAEDFGTDRNPLTGELVDNPANLQRLPIAIKISNAPAQFTRPQSGLNDADWVFEHTAEGNLTRFTAVFYDSTPEKIGPVRSARLIDIELPAMFHAALAYSGSSNGVGQKLQNSDFANRILYAWEKGYYRTGETDKPIEHTFFANPTLLWENLAEKGLEAAPQFDTFNVFSDTPPEGGTEADGVTIDYNWTLVNWRYDGNSGRYLRWADGVPHLDGNTLEQVEAANVVVLSPFHAFDGNICEQVNADGTCASLSVEIQLWGTGTGVVLRDGRAYDVVWHREGRGDTLTFTDMDGNPFPLKIGNTWVQLVPTWLENPVTVTP